MLLILSVVGSASLLFYCGSPKLFGDELCLSHHAGYAQQVVESMVNGLIFLNNRGRSSHESPGIPHLGLPQTENPETSMLHEVMMIHEFDLFTALRDDSSDT